MSEQLETWVEGLKDSTQDISMTGKYVITQATFDPDAVIISYLIVPDDLRETGLHLTRQITIPTDTDEYDDEIDLALVAVKSLLADAVEDMANLRPYDPNELTVVDEDDDDDDE